MGPERAALLASLAPGTSVDMQGQRLPGNGEVYLYSGQKLNTGDWQQDLMLQRLARDRAATFTRATEFMSQTISLVNAERKALEDAAATRAAWKTAEGFVYPAHKSRAEDVRHPRRPPQSVVDALAKPWVEPNELMAEERARRQAAEALPMAVPFRGDYVEPAPLKTQRGQFGYLDPRDNSQRMLEFLASVHPTGDVLDAQRLEDREVERAEFARKVVVEDTRFLGFESHDGLAKVNRVHSLLRDEPKKATLRMLSTGRPLSFTNVAPAHGKGAPATAALGVQTAPYSNNPLSMDATLPFVPPPRDKILERQAVPSKFVGVDRATGRSTDFATSLSAPISGLPKARYVPEIEASSRPTGIVGTRPVVKRIALGINTDSKH